MSNNEQEYPEIGVVIIGLNAAKDIENCIEAVLKSDYPQDKIELIYVDGGSDDNSISLAQKYDKVRVVELNHPFPSPGRGRNAGFKACTKPLIQLVDSDSYIQPGWFKKAVTYFKDDIGAVWGQLFERYPDKNWYHKVANFDWGVVSGEKGWANSEGYMTIFGGNVLIKREALEATNGFDESLIAGEDPDLSYRVRQKGWKIYRIGQAMASHDINMNQFKIYSKRAFRSGYAYAQIGMRYRKEKEKLFYQRIFRILVSGILPAAVFFLGVLIGYPFISFALALLLALRPVRKLGEFKKTYNMSTTEALIYGLHLSYVIYPQLFGLLRYFWGQLIKNPLQNKSKKNIKVKEK